MLWNPQHEFRSKNCYKLKRCWAEISPSCFLSIKSSQFLLALPLHFVKQQHHVYRQSYCWAIIVIIIIIIVIMVMIRNVEQTARRSHKWTNNNMFSFDPELPWKKQRCICQKKVRSSIGKLELHHTTDMHKLIAISREESGFISGSQVLPEKIRNVLVLK